MTESTPAQSELESRVLVLAPTGRDRTNCRTVLSHAKLSCTVCEDVEDLCQQIRTGVGAVLLTEESLAAAGTRCLPEVLQTQPPWSDLPFIALTRGGPDSPAAQRAMESLGNVVLLERPVRIATLITAVRTALRARSRQYESRARLIQLKDADKRKDEFLATLAHELRNPLAPIRSALELLRLSGSSPQMLEESREIMERQLKQMVHLIDDLLDVSRITRGKLQLRRELVDLSIAFDNAVETVRPFLLEKQHELTVSVPSEPIVLHADLTRLSQIIANLLNNSAKYMEPGGRIWLTAVREQAEVIVRVRDLGIGIPPEDLPHIFDMFVQADRSIERSRGGLGIGLTLVRRLVEMHGGEIAASSGGPGTGSEFIVRLPIAEASGSQTPRAAAPDPVEPQNPKRILVVDDNVDAAATLELVLKLVGHEVRTANDGYAAIDAVESFHPDVVLLDLGMPRLNGFETCRRIRAIKGGEQARVIALTGWGQSEDQRRTKDAGFDGHLVKPVDFPP